MVKMAPALEATDDSPAGASGAETPFWGPAELTLAAGRESPCASPSTWELPKRSVLKHGRPRNVLS